MRGWGWGGGRGTIFDKTTKHAVIILRLKLVYSFDIENVCNSLGTAFGGKLQLGPLGGELPLRSPQDETMPVH